MRRATLVAVFLIFSLKHADAGLDKLIEQNIKDATQSYERTLSGYQVSTEPARLWVHVRNDSQKELGGKLLELVTKINLEGREIESKPLQLVDFGPEKSQLRFFKQRDKNEAIELLELLRRHIPQIELRNLSRGFSNVGWLQSGHYELWFSPGLTTLESPE